MATTGPALYPGSGTFPGSTTFPGQGIQPNAEVLYSTDDASVASPNWVYVPASRIKSFSVSRGRENELSDIDAGTASIVLDNRTRLFDPVSNPLIRPLNRWWIREKFSGETQDIFKGYAESYHQSWPSPVGDAETTVTCSDEFKVLSMDRLPTMDPPRDNYADMIQADNPSAYWRWQDNNLKRTSSIIVETGGEDDQNTYRSEVGVTDWSGSIFSIINETPIVGDFSQTGGGALRMSASAVVTALNVSSGSLSGSGGIEFWLRKSGNPGGTVDLMGGPQDLTFALRTWQVQMTSTGTVGFRYLDGTGAYFSVFTATALDNNTWYHVVALRDQNNNLLRIYLNGVQNNTAADGIQWADNPGAPFMAIQGATGITSVDYAEIATYPSVSTLPISAARIAAHYTAGTARGFPTLQDPGARISAVLDQSVSDASRSIRPGTNPMQGSFMRGQSPLDEAKQAVKAEAEGAVFFVSRSGELIFYEAGYTAALSVSSTWDDDGTDLPYEDLTMDYSEAFLFNEWNVTRGGGLTQTASDTTSISRYYKRSQSVTDLPVTTDAIAAGVAAGQLAKYKDPITRITSLTLSTVDIQAAEQIFRQEIGDKIRVFRTPPGGGSRIDQSLTIQKISVDAQPGVPWRVTWAVSPL